MKLPAALLLLVACALALTLVADGPADNRAENVRPVPPAGVKIAEADRTEIESGAKRLREAIDALQTRATNQTLARFIPEVEIFHKALRYALDYDEIYDATNDVKAARQVIEEGLARAAQLANGETPWNTTSGLVVRAYVSKIDGSVQPYGLVVPPSYTPTSAHKFRLDTWYHGRDEKLTELRFLRDRMRDKGQFTPDNAFVLHLYGRYCNANKLAGEVDLLEVLEHVQKHYPIDTNRLVNRGFSMGGAAAWQFAVHYPSLWAASAPGAGFSETPQFLRVFQDEKVQPTDYERALWHIYDCTDYALNLFNVPTVAYSGEIDRQKQAADVMAEAMLKEGLELTHLIGPKTGHSYHRDSKKELDARIDAIVANGKDPMPREVKFTTWTLRYNESAWVRVEGLEQHWRQARVEAAITADSNIEIETKNVNALALQFGPGSTPLQMAKPVKILIDGATINGPRGKSDRSWHAYLVKQNGAWRLGAPSDLPALRKKPALQGPVDDAFMDSFVFVRPTASGFSTETDQWVRKEMAHAIEHWRKQFRGDARIIDDRDLTPEIMATNNIVLWGDPASNRSIAELLPSLPLKWTAEEMAFADKKFPGKAHTPILIYPNPKAPNRYVVLNSGFTFREYDYLNNARQVPKLPDYAVVDITHPVTSRAPGKIAHAGFFNEEWQLK